MNEDYLNIVNVLESHLPDYAMKSFDSITFVDGSDLFRFYNQIWTKESEKLKTRTPIQHQRDKILYSNGIRKQTEKYHVLFKGGQRIIRNYITHTMRMMQVCRTICRTLKLNEDFAEAIVLGTKIGALPFIHASKTTVSKWIEKTIHDLDSAESKNNVLKLVDSDYLPDHPNWIRNLRSKNIIDLTQQYIPFACGKKVNDPYSSGKQGYWLLTTNPYTVESIPHSFCPELMFGIWRHSLNTPYGEKTFNHEQKVKNALNKCHKITFENISFESLVVQYADDITWVLENLNDADTATLMHDENSKGLFRELFLQGDFEQPLLIQGLNKKDTGKLYSYFINDFISHSSNILLRKDGTESKVLLKRGEKDVMIGLSKEGNEVLDIFKTFLNDHVFSENRVSHRKKMLETITEGCCDLIYNGKNEYIKKYISTKANIEGWSDEQKEISLSLLDNNIHRIQVTVNIISELSDQELFSFVGMESF